MAAPPPRGIRYGTPNTAYIRRIAALPPEQDGPCYMVNLMKYRATAAYSDGDGEAISGREADDRYSPRAILSDIGASVVLHGDVVAQSGGEPRWDRVGIVRYPSRAAFLAMQRRPDFQEKHVHKDAGMEFTIVLLTLAPDAPATPPPNSAGPDTILVEVLPAAAPDAPPGVTTLQVEDEVIGDGRPWAAVRLSCLPADAPPPSPDAPGYVLHIRPTIDRITSPPA